MISTLQRFAGIGEELFATKHSNANFNANLPVCVEVIKELGANRFRLKIGKKELTTKSFKSLKVKQRYWANFSQSKEGILSISNLFAQPELFCNDSLFLPFNFEEFNLKKELNFDEFRTFLLTKLHNNLNNADEFKTYSYMLLALSKGIIHLPLQFENKKALLQFRMKEDKKLVFYLALDHLGPLSGILSEKECFLEAMYQKTIWYLEKERTKFDMLSEIRLTREIKPLFDLSNLLVDLKG